MSHTGSAESVGYNREQIESDLLFDQHVFRFLTYSATGLAVGVAASLFFRHKRNTIIFFSGIGAGEALFDFRKAVENYKSLGHHTARKYA